MRILIIDDDMRIVTSTALYLKTKGFTLVDTITDSRDVLKKMAATEYDVVLLDLSMPYISGTTLLETIKSHHATTEVLIISAIDSKEVKAMSMELGASQYFTKPIDGKNLVQTLININNTLSD